MLTSASSCKTMRVIWAPCRITPACAGNRVETSHAPPPKKNHPRLRGEQSPGGYITYPGEGSPPLARGTVYATLPGTRFSGITPACAGNSFHNPPHARGAWDHPRLRGEQAACPSLSAFVLGSPPLARGTDADGRPAENPYRITPACAGNSKACLYALRKVRDHPRLRGEQ